MDHLPFDIELFIADFLLHDEKIRFGSCCKSFYHNLVLPHMRIFKRRTRPFFTSYFNDAELREKVSQCSTATLDLPPLPPTLQSLFLDGPYTNVVNEIALLHNLQSLTLFRVDSLTDVSMLGNIPVITLKSCRNITDITPLQNSYIIRIKSCKGIKDYRHSFTNTKNLMIIYPNREALFDFQHCQRLQTLYLDTEDYVHLLEKLPNTLKRLKLYTDNEIDRNLFKSL
eukprot:gene6034-6485_t